MWKQGHVNRIDVETERERDLAVNFYVALKDSQCFYVLKSMPVTVSCCPWS